MTFAVSGGYADNSGVPSNHMSRGTCVAIFNVEPEHFEDMSQWNDLMIVLNTSI